MAKSQLQKFKEEIVREIRENFQSEYGLCEEGVLNFFEAMGLTEIDREQAKVVTISFPYRGQIEAADIKAHLKSYDFKYAIGIDSNIENVDVVIK